MPNIWHPLEGAQNSDLGEKRFLFKFFNEVDIHRVLTEALWTFNSHLLIAHMIQENEDPLSIPLVYSDWWVQIHDLPPGFFRESVTVQFGNFIGKFLEYDMKQLSNGYKSFLRIRVKIDVRKLLKRRKKIMISESNFTYAKFKYEKLTLFCFLCGCLGHRDSFCPMRLQCGIQEVEVGWDLTLRAQPRRATTVNNIWLREEGEIIFLERIELSSNWAKIQGTIMREDHEFDCNHFLGINLEGSKFEFNYSQKQESRPIIGGDLLPRKGQQLESNLNCGELIKGLEDVRPRNGLNLPKMDCELENDPIASEERNKRQRFDSLTSNVSIIPDSFEVTDGQFAHFKTLLAIFNGYADRKK